MPEPISLLNNAETARLLGVSPRTLPKWRLRGDGPPFVRVGRRRVLYRLDAIETYLAARSRRSTSDSGEEGSDGRP